MPEAEHASRMLALQEGIFCGISSGAAIHVALETAKKYTKENIVVKSDSELIIKQLTGKYQVKSPHLKSLYQEVLVQIEYFSSVNFSHVSRQNTWIKKADKLCNDLLNHKKI